MAANPKVAFFVAGATHNHHRPALSRARIEPCRRPPTLLTISLVGNAPECRCARAGPAGATKPTMPDDAGLFLDRTWRMHPRLCDYSSRTFYEGRLFGIPGLELQRVDGPASPFAESGLYVLPLPHQGNTNSSPEEAAKVAELVRRLCSCRWTDKYGATRPMTVEDVLVVTPYNAQIREIERKFAQSGIKHVKVGTVDKFQGREAPAVIEKS